MLRLSEPTDDLEYVLDECIRGITGNSLLQVSMQIDKQSILEAWQNYVNKDSVGNLFRIAPTTKDDVSIFEKLKKSDLIKVYNDYFVPKNKPGNKFYEKILNAAKGKCPYCGGIGAPRNLDHYLPKSFFPQFSVLPQNLIPTCRDCNIDGKKNRFASKEEEQIIHPYIDKAIFYNEQWIDAIYCETGNDDLGIFEYFVDTPDEWSDVDKKRAERHFQDFDLARRYATKAAEASVILMAQISHLRAVGLNNEDIDATLVKPAIKALPLSFVNNWQMIMYKAVAKLLIDDCDGGLV